MRTVLLTEAQDAYLRANWKNPAVTIGQMIHKLKLSKHVVRKRARELDLGERVVESDEWPSARVQEAVRLYVDERKTPSEIAERFGLTRNMVNSKLNRLGVLRRRPSDPPLRKPVVATTPSPKPPAQKREKAPTAGLKVLAQPHQYAGFNNPAKQLGICGNGAVFEKQPAAPPKVEVLPKAWRPLPGSTPVPMLDLGSRHCRWPIEVPGQELHFCGLTQASESSYCPTHTVRSHGSGTPSERKADAVLKARAAA